MTQYEKAINYLPHESPMVLVEDVYDVSEEHIVCGALVSKEGILAPFLNSQFELPAWFAIEMMAQSIGVWSGFFGKKQQLEPKLGMLLGSRAFKSSLSEFPCGAQLLIKAEALLQDDKLASFDCSLSIGEEVIVRAKLNVYQPDDLEIKELTMQRSIR